MQQRFLLQILLLAQRISGTTMPINRSSRVLSHYDKLMIELWWQCSIPYVVAMCCHHTMIN